MHRVDDGHLRKASISSEAARRLIAAAEAKAAELGKPFVTAVVDDAGVLKAALAALG